MTKEKYMALEDLQTVWNDSMKPFVLQQAGADFATVGEAEAAARELT